MVITIVCDVLGKENNGTTIAAMNLIRFLKKQGHEVRILCGDQDKKNEENVFVVSNFNFGKMLNNYVDKVGVTLAKPDQKIIKSALKGADLVHIMVPLPLGLATIKVAKEMNLPVTAGFHMQAENLTCYLKMNKIKPLNKFVYKFIYKKMYKYVDGIHYPTAFIRGVFEKNIKHTTPGYVISNGVHDYVKKRDTEKPEEYKDKIVILTTGRYAREKSQDILIKAIAKSQYRDRIQLILGGQGTKEKYYRKLAKKLPVAPVFKLFPRNELIDVLNYSDLYIHPAEVELEGIACLEAIACGKLTIVSDSKLSATREFAIDEKCVFKNRKPKDLTRVMDYWISHEDERKQYEQKYLESAKVFNQNECMKRMEQMMIEVYKNHKQKPAEQQEESRTA